MLSITTKVHPTGFRPVTETLPQAIERIVSELRPEKIILFGSYADVFRAEEAKAIIHLWLNSAPCSPDAIS